MDAPLARQDGPPDGDRSGPEDAAPPSQAASPDPAGAADPVPPLPPWPLDDAVTGAAAADGRLRTAIGQATRMHLLGRLAPGLLHDVNNPLAAITAFAHVLQTDPRLPDDLRDDAALVLEEAERTRRIVATVLEFARARPPERQPTALRPLVASVLELAAHDLAANGIDVRGEIPDDIPDVPIDRPQLQLVVLSLVDNAVDAVRRRDNAGTISIDVERGGGPPATTVRLSVTDDGTGVDPGHEARIFDPFFTTSSNDRLGLGLPVARGIVEAHGGRLWLERRTGPGAMFVVELPVVERGTHTGHPGRRPQTRTGAARTDAAAANAATRPRVLVVDDEPSIRRFLDKALAAAGFETTPAAGAAEALEHVRDTAFDAVLCDHRLPDGSGPAVYDACVAVRPELTGRFVLMTGDVLDADLQVMARARGLELLSKPFDIGTVRRTVRRLIDAAGEDPGT